MVKGARQWEWPRHLSTHKHTHTHPHTHTHTQRTLPTTMSVLETPFDIHVSSVYQTHTCMQAPIPTLCIQAKNTHNKGSRTRPIMSTLMPRSGIPVICSRATLSCDSSYLPLNQVFSEKTLEYSHLMAKLQVFSLFTISLGRPEIFEKVAKIGVGVHICLLQVTILTHN